MTDSPSRLAAEIRKLERNHEEDPEGRYFVPLADAYRQLGELEHAELLLRDGLRRHPEYLGAHVVLGRCLLDRGDAEGAAEEFRQVIARDPQNLVALRTLGELAAAAGRREEAEHWYRELLAVDPLNDDARRAGAALGAALEAAPAVENETRPAEREAEHAEEEGAWAESEVITETIAELYARQGVYDLAAEVYRELVRRGETRPALVQRLLELERLAAAERRGADEVPALEPAPSIAAYLAELLAWSSASGDAFREPARGFVELPLGEAVGASADAAEVVADDFAGLPPRREGSASAPRARAAWQAEEQSLHSAAAHPREGSETAPFQQWLRSLHG